MFQSFSALFGGAATATPPPPAKEAPPRLALGLALGAGAARGWAHIGILRRLERAGIVPDVIAGTSIGAVAGGCAVAGHLDALEAFARGLDRKRVLGLLDLSLGGGGLIGGRRLGEMLSQHLGDTRIEDLPRPFAAVATELGTGHEVWLKRGPLADALRASYALPGLLPPVRIGGRWLMDGAVVDPVPVTVCRALGARVVIAVNLNSEAYTRGITLTDHGPEAEDADWSTTGEGGPGEEKNPRRKLLGRAEGPPGLSTVMVEAFNIATDRIARSRLAGDPPDVTIAPRLAKIALYEFHRAAEAIALGEEAAERALVELEPLMTEAA
jgi:NTE family protein